MNEIYYAVFDQEGNIAPHTIKPTEYEAGDSFSEDYYFDHFEKKGYTISKIKITKID
jgi:hypothetical protein